MDGFSRYLLPLSGAAAPLSAPVQDVFESAFREFGLPQTIRTDNGAPFSTSAPGGLSRLAVWWIRLGIRPERILPGRPDQNGRHERMHSTLKAETARPPRSSWRAQQRCFEAFRQEYNHERPHEALAYATPASQYQPSLRAYPRQLPQPEYPGALSGRARLSQWRHLRFARRSGISATASPENWWGLKRWMTIAGRSTLARSNSGCSMHEAPRRAARATSASSSAPTARSRPVAAAPADDRQGDGANRPTHVTHVPGLFCYLCRRSHPEARKKYRRRAAVIQGRVAGSNQLSASTDCHARSSVRCDPQRSCPTGAAWGLHRSRKSGSHRRQLAVPPMRLCRARDSA